MKISPVEKAKVHFEEAIIQYLDRKNFIIAITLTQHFFPDLKYDYQRKGFAAAK